MSERQFRRERTHAGVFLKEFMDELNLTDEKTAHLLEISLEQMNEILYQQKGISDELALKLSVVFDKTDKEFWINVQKSYDNSKDIS